MAVLSGRGVDRGHAYSDVQSGYSGTDASQREDLANFISMITRDETPFMSSIGKTKATAIYHEWQTDELNTPGNSRIGEGTDYILPGTTNSLGGNPDTPSVPSAFDGQGNVGGGMDAVAGGDAFNPIGANRTRLGNYTQINGKTISISGTRRAVDQAGVADEYAYQLKKRGTELRRDLEFDLIHSFNTSGQSVSGGITSPQGGTGARTFGGYQAWINDPRTVIYANTNASAPGEVANGREAPTLGTVAQRSPLALSHIDEAMQMLYEQGGKANKLMLSPKLRRDFSDLMVTDSGVRRNIDMDGKLRQSVDVYMSDFGDVMVVPNYIMGLSHSVNFGNANNSGTAGGVNVANFAALLYDPMWFAIATLRPLQEVDVGQRGDSTIGMMVEEMTLEVKNPQGCGAIYGLE